MNSIKSGSARKPAGAGRRSARHRARQFAVQGLYQWLLAGTAVATIEQQLAETTGFDKIDTAYFQCLLRGAIGAQAELETLIAPYLDRPVRELSPVERGILLLAGFELMRSIEVPYRVVINEAVELAKTYGGTDWHKYVNGVLDNMAGKLRDLEINGATEG